MVKSLVTPLLSSPVRRGRTAERVRETCCSASHRAHVATTGKLRGERLKAPNNAAEAAETHNLRRGSPGLPPRCFPSLSRWAFSPRSQIAMQAPATFAFSSAAERDLGRTFLRSDPSTYCHIPTARPSPRRHLKQKEGQEALDFRLSCAPRESRDRGKPLSQQEVTGSRTRKLEVPHQGAHPPRPPGDGPAGTGRHVTSPRLGQRHANGVLNLRKARTSSPRGPAWPQRSSALAAPSSLWPHPFLRQERVLTRPLTHGCPGIFS